KRKREKKEHVRTENRVRFLVRYRQETGHCFRFSLVLFFFSLFLFFVWFVCFVVVITHRLTRKSTEPTCTYSPFFKWRFSPSVSLTFITKVPLELFMSSMNRFSFSQVMQACRRELRQLSSDS